MARAKFKKRESQKDKDPKDEILKAALQLFTHKGFFNTSVADIKKEADVSTGTIYHYFKNKEAIAEALLYDLIESMNNSIDEINKRNKTALERLHAVMELLFVLTEQAPDVVNFIIASRHQEFLPQQKPISLSQPFEKLREIMREGMNSGEIRRMDPTVANACFYGTIARMIQLRLEGLLEKPLDHYLNEAWTAAWRSIAVL